MRTLVIIGALLIIIGAIGLIYGGISYTKTREAAEVGPVDVTVQENRWLDIEPALGGVIAATGLTVLVIGVAKKKG